MKTKERTCSAKQPTAGKKSEVGPARKESTSTLEWLRPRLDSRRFRAGLAPPLLARLIGQALACLLRLVLLLGGLELARFVRGKVRTSGGLLASLVLVPVGPLADPFVLSGMVLEA